MNKILIIPFIFFAGLKLQAQEINFFTGTYQEAKAKSLSEGKPLMVYISADWCGYCKYSENVTYKQDTIYEYLNENYICIKLDQKSKEGKQMSREYSLEVLPSYIFFDNNNKYVRHYDGFLCAQKLKVEAEKAKKKKKRLFETN
ncbi:MAG: thioredoxin family protein [Bacteroidetes bacterium]|nr:thioredoxin family protein [Bacteroidota bacterium]